MILEIFTILIIAGFGIILMVYGLSRIKFFAKYNDFLAIVMSMFILFIGVFFVGFALTLIIK